MPTSSTHKEPNDLIIKRGHNEPSPISRALFVLLRGLDLPLQYGILAGMMGGSIIEALHGVVRTPGSPLILGGTSIGLSPYRTILFSMAVGSVLKHNLWVLMISHETITPVGSVLVGVVHAVYNTLNTLLFNCSATSAVSSPAEESVLTTPLVVGTGLFAVGMFLEWVSEVQRKKFKADPKNKGKLFTGGLFGLSRHINYGGYTMWRAGFALASAGWAWGAFVAVWLGYDFVRRGIPEMDVYCTRKYGDAWVDYKKKTPYLLLPGIC